MKEKLRNEDKLLTIQRYLSSGMSRNEAAAKLGYNGWRSLDIFMRRSGMRWEGSLNRYISLDDAAEAKKPVNDQSTDTSSKAARVIGMFRDENPDPKQIAKTVGFKDHMEMASYMSLKGYNWSAEQSNYVRNTENAPKQRGSRNNDALDIQSDDPTVSDIDGVNRYSRLLDILVNNEERLLELLIPEAYSRTIPRYFVPGITRTKSFYMSDSLSKLLNEFCSDKNLSQKEVVEAAIVEFLSKYSFKKEVDNLIRGR